MLTSCAAMHIIHTDHLREEKLKKRTRRHATYVSRVISAHPCSGVHTKRIVFGVCLLVYAYIQNLSTSTGRDMHACGDISACRDIGSDVFLVLRTRAFSLLCTVHCTFVPCATVNTCTTELLNPSKQQYMRTQGKMEWYL
jgi:hypothetical protein